MDRNNLTTTLEAILFACGDSVSIDKIAEALDISKESVHEAVMTLNEKYDSMNSALIALKLGDEYQLTVRKEYSEEVKKVLESKKNTPLSNAAMEALTVVAYNEPVTKGFVEHVRGVDSSGVMNSLVEKGLIEEAGRLDLPGKPIAYKTTTVFLRVFGLSSLDDLPELPNKPNTEEIEDELQEETL